jgi:steroid 5-alpha reductase family enzyme
MTVDWTLPLQGGLVGMGVMLVLWTIQLRTRNAAIVDFGWAALLGSFAVFYAVAGDGWGTRRVLLAGLGGLWGYRLAGHLLVQRLLGGAPEEGRYVTLRRKWRLPYDLHFLIFFQAQALLAVTLSLPFLLAAGDAHPAWRWSDLAAGFVALGGWIGESIADRQLDRFKRDPSNRGRTCREGLWRYSRHPNYFFEWTIWIGFALLGLGAPYGWLGFAAPALLLASILKVTGIPPTEEQAVASRGEDYRRYQRTTSAFFPWFPKESTP